MRTYHKKKESIDNHKPVVHCSVFLGESLKFFIHGLVEALAQEERPEPVECVHFLTLANTKSFTLYKREEKCQL